MLSPPWKWSTLKLPPGIWTLSVIATDWAGNESESKPVVIGVDMDPPPMPPEEEEGDTDAQSDDTEGSTSSDAATWTDSSSSNGDTGDTGDAPATAGDSGCSCRSAAGSHALGLGCLLLLAIARHRRATTCAAPDQKLEITREGWCA